MEVILFLAGLFAIAVALFMFYSGHGKRISTKLKCLVVSVLVAVMTALWCVVYGPDVWIMIQAGILIVMATALGLLLSRGD